MKTKKSNLKLNKETISNLKKKEMTEVYGGGISEWISCWATKKCGTGQYCTIPCEC
jgi:hypothetical protein